MKRLLAFLICSGIQLAAAEFSSVHAVYLLPMGSALDQYLANRLTSEHVFQVVTDPKLADAVFTDRIGNAFEEKLAELTAPPAAALPSSSQAAPSQAAAGQPAPNQSAPQTASPLPTDTVNKLSNPATNSSFGHGKGTIFLVDRKSKRVIWSVFEPLKGSTSTQMDHSASDIVSRLKRDMKNSEEGKP